MTRKRNIGSVAALGGAVAAMALLTGLGSAGADELADLKANQELLKQRIDQLALGAPNPVAPGSTSLAGSFPRSFLIPGTNTSLAIGGYVELDATYWLTGGGALVNGNEATPNIGAGGTVQSIPLGTGPGSAGLFNAHARGNGVFEMSAKESRLRVETRTPTAWGEADTVLEFDFYGCQAGGADCANLNHSTNPFVPRLRLAYGTLGGFEAGQNWVPVSDLAAHAELFDFGGEIGTFGYARAPQIGYLYQLPWGATFGAYLVDPDTEVWSPVGAFETDSTLGIPGTFTPSPATGTGVLAVNPAKSSYPDGNFVLEFHQPWGHFRLSGIVQDLKLQDGQYISKEYIGYGGGFGMNVHPGWFGWAKDNIGAEAWAGSGLGRYATSSGGGSSTFENALATNYAGAAANFYGSGLPGTTTLANAALVRAATVTQWGGTANYQHFWAPNLRSTLSFGMLHQDVPTSLVGPFSAATSAYNKELVTAHANLIWSPVAFVDTGIEYVYGHRQTVYNGKGDLNAIDFSFRVKF
jgi:hypothetical protein